MKKRVTGIGDYFLKHRINRPSKIGISSTSVLNATNTVPYFNGGKKKIRSMLAIRFGVLLKKILLISTQAKKNSCSTNYRVENLVELLEELRKEGVTIVGT